MLNFYRVLGVTAQADDAQLKLAFRRLAKKFHPDLNGGHAAQRFREIHRAYATLRDPARRAAYDSECAQARVQAHRRWRSAAVTMSVCFALTVSSGLLVAAWMQVEAWTHVRDHVPAALTELDRALPLALGVSD